MKRPIICLNSTKNFKVSIQIDNLIFPEYINMNFIVHCYRPEPTHYEPVNDEDIQHEDPNCDKKSKKKRRNINMNITKKKRNWNQVTKTR